LDDFARAKPAQNHPKLPGRRTQCVSLDVKEGFKAKKLQNNRKNTVNHYLSFKKAT
jgi:hypothetical protein